MANFKYCPNCGAYLSDEKGYLVCHKCGKKYEVVLKQLTDEEKEAKYQKALSLMNEHNYRQAEVVLKTIKNYKDVNNLL
ncbi:MAG: hypothetical protein J5666_04280, partial [Bacilli bacterium]|nr:hypothetical protein [Bacilli bacterium]